MVFLGWAPSTSEAYLSTLRRLADLQHLVGPAGSSWDVAEFACLRSIRAGQTEQPSKRVVAALLFAHHLGFLSEAPPDRLRQLYATPDHYSAQAMQGGGILRGNQFWEALDDELASPRLVCEE